MLRLALFGVFVVLAAATHFLPWWALLVSLLLLIVGLKLLGPRLLKSVVRASFRLKGNVLRGATAKVDDVQPCEPPANAEASPDITRWWQVEVTITPKDDAAGSFKAWEPGELRLTEPVDKGHDENDAEEDDRFPIVALEIYIEARDVAALSEDAGAALSEGWQVDPGWKLPGKRRLRFKLGTPESVRQLSLKYYFERLGSLQLPGRAAATSPD